jgi:hypothetical protein
MKTIAITVLLSLTFALSQQSLSTQATSLGLNLPEAIKVLDYVDAKFHSLRDSLASEKKFLSTGTNFQVDPASITAGIGAVTAGIDAVNKAVALYDDFFDRFFNTTAIKEASAYMSNKASEMYKVDQEESLKALNLITLSLITLVDVRAQVNNMMDVVIDGSDIVTGIYDQLVATPNLTDDQKAQTFIKSVDSLDKTLEDALTTVSDNRARLVKVQEDMAILINSFAFLQDRFTQAKKDSSDFMEAQLQTFKDQKMKLCIGVCIGSVLTGPLAIPICTACIDYNYGGVIPAETARLRGELGKVEVDMDGFVASFTAYKNASVDIKTQTEAEIVALDDWKKDITIMRNRIMQYKNLNLVLPATIALIRDSVATMKKSCQKLKEKFLATNDPTIKYMEMFAKY